MRTLAFIGAGNIAKCLIAGLIENHYPLTNLFASSPNQEKLTALQTEFGIQVTQNNKDAASFADVLILCVKPQVVGDVLKELRTVILEKKQVVISVAAGVRVATIESQIGQQIPIVRGMPNIAATVKTSATGLYKNNGVTSEISDLAESLFRAVGVTAWVSDEAKLDLITALSGSGPAYFFYLMEAMQETAVNLGLDSETAHLFVRQTALGAAHMAMTASVDLPELRARVTSPKGTTASALKVLAENNFKALVAKALEAAKDRAQEIALGKE